MILYICKICGYFRDVTGLAFFAHPDGNVAQYNKSVTHCPEGHGEMYQVQKGDKLAVMAEVTKCLLCNSADAVACVYEAEEHGIEIPMYLCLKCFNESDIPPIKMR